MRAERVFFAVVAAMTAGAFLAPPAGADLPVATYLEVNGGATPQSIDVAWSLTGPIDMPMFSVDPARIVATFRRKGYVTSHRMAPAEKAPFAASRVEMTMDRLTQAFVHFDAGNVPAGSYAIDVDARRAVRWHGKPVAVQLVTPTVYVYVSGVDARKQPDAEIRALGRTYASRRAHVAAPFVMDCTGTGTVGVSAGSPIGVTGFARDYARQIGNGPDATHPATPTGPNGVGSEEHAFTALTAIGVSLSDAATADGRHCAQGTADFASPADIARYLRP